MVPGPVALVSFENEWEIQILRPNKCKTLGVGSSNLCSITLVMLVCAWIWKPLTWAVCVGICLVSSFVLLTNFSKSVLNLTAHWNHLEKLYAFAHPWISRRPSYENCLRKTLQVILIYSWSWESLFWIISRWSVIWNLFFGQSQFLESNYPWLNFPVYLLDYQLPFFPILLADFWTAATAPYRE